MINCVYIHIPFCEKKCNYCAFCSFSLIKKKEIYIEALLKEINLAQPKLTLKYLLSLFVQSIVNKELNSTEYQQLSETLLNLI